MSDILTNAVRLLAAQFRNKGGDLGAAAATIFDLLGEEGDPHEMRQRHPTKILGASQPKDTTRGAVSLDRHKHDLNYHPGKGFTYSDHRGYDWSKAGRDAGLDDKLSARFIPEGEIVRMAAEAAAHRGMFEARDMFLVGVRERSQRHPGFDTLDAGKSGMHSGSDDHKIDRSESTVHLSIMRGDTWLNASQVKHSSTVAMRVNGPDGRQLCAVQMSFDQFAAFLTSQGMVPCTVTDYWSINDANVRMHERVRPVDTVGDRLGRRIGARVDEQFKDILEVAAQLTAAAEAGKPVNKTVAARMAADLARAASHTRENLIFAADQAQEEVAGVVEQAAVHMSLSFGVNLDLLRSQPMMATLGVQQPLLPAPSDEPTGSG